jgi:hypothetical protein
MSFCVKGGAEKARKFLNLLLDLRTRRYFDRYFVAQIYAALGEKDKAFEFLDRGYRERDYLLSFLKVDPKFDSLRSDPRYQDILRRIKLSP